MKIIITQIIFILFFYSCLIFAQTNRDVYFSKVDEVKRNAELADAAVLSPISFSKAHEHYTNAEDLFYKGITGGSLDANINTAVEYYKKSRGFAEAAKIKLSFGYEARTAAAKTEAATHAGNIWNEAEKIFGEAAEQLENGHIETAVNLSKEAEAIYKKAEFISIKSFYLDETYKLIEEAEEMEAEDFAPKTLKKAKSLAAFAEKELSINRYDTQRPKDLALDALFEAKHTIFLTKLFKKVKKDNITYEELLLEIEEPYKVLAAAFKKRAELDKGFEHVKIQLLHEIDKLKRENSDLERNNSELITKINILESENGVGLVNKSKVNNNNAFDEDLRDSYTIVSNMFRESEAIVFKEGFKVTIRLIGLVFDPSSSELKDFHFSLLKKVVKAVNKFPESKIRIEGHTDSSGDSIINMRLSEERAFTVLNYIKKNTSLKLSQLSAIGYGQTNPIASNSSRAGRAVNKRIDVVITP